MATRFILIDVSMCLLAGDLKQTHTWLALNNGATLEVSIGHGHTIKKKSKKLFRSWSVHRIGKV